MRSLEAIADQHELPRVIILELAQPVEAALHLYRQAGEGGGRGGPCTTSYSQAIAAAGAFPSDPNLQNIPIRTERGRRIRQAFVAPPGFRILAADCFADRAAHHGLHPATSACLAAFHGNQTCTAPRPRRCPACLLEQVDGNQRRAGPRRSTSARCTASARLRSSPSAGIPREANDCRALYFPAIRACAFADATCASQAPRRYVGPVRPPPSPR